MINRIILIVMDSVGVGHMPDADRFHDDGANTLLHIFRQRGRLDIPHLCSLGLGRLVDVGCGAVQTAGCYGRMGEQSPAKDTTVGHWEIAGVILESPLPTYPGGFPPNVIGAFEEMIGRKTLGNCPSSGTAIIRTLGMGHLRTGYPIVYTSADSVFQIAAHKDMVPLETLYGYCRMARHILRGEHGVGRVIARPFTGPPGQFERDNGARRDFSLPPPSETLLDVMTAGGLFVVGIGKIGDIFGHRGLTEEIHTDGNESGIEKIIQVMNRQREGKGLIFANLVDFDMIYGHRRDAEGYAKALEAFDRGIPRIMDAMSGSDVLIITADHGCDPTHSRHTDHTREYVPLMVYGKPVKGGVDLGTRDTFADCGQTIADMLGVGALKNGKSFKEVIALSD